MGWKYSHNESYFDSIETPGQAYWLGFLTADGNVYDNIIRIGLQERDAGHLRKFAGCIESGAPVTPVTHKINGKTYKGAQINVCSRQMAESLMRLGVTPRKSLTVKPWNGPAELMPAYWRGLFDGDGTIGKYSYDTGGTEWRVGVAGSHDCVDGFARWAREVCGSRAQLQQKSAIWEWVVQGTGTPRLLAHELEAAYDGLERKQELLRELIATPSQRNPSSLIPLFPLIRAPREEPQERQDDADGDAEGKAPEETLDDRRAHHVNGLL